MATITLEVDDHLAERLQFAGDRLSTLLTQALDSAGIPGIPKLVSPTSLAWLEAVDFLAQTPTPQQIIDFKISPAAQERLEGLLEEQRTSNITPTERAELETYRQVNHLFIALKARTRLSLNNN